MNIWLITLFLGFISCSSYHKAEAPQDNISEFKSKLQQLERECHQRDFITCSKYIKLLSVLKGPEVAIETADRRCTEGQADFCYLKGYVQFYSGSVSEGERTLRMACDKNNALACQFLGLSEVSRHFEDNKWVPLEIQKACSLGFKRACAGIYFRKDFPYDLTAAKAKKLLENYNSEEAQDLWDLTYYFHRVYARNSTLAIKYLTLSCENGNPDACWFLENYRLSEHEFNEQKENLQKSYCNKNSGRACTEICSSAVEQKDEERAMQLCHRGCLLDSPESCMDMAQLLERNENLTEAKFYYKLDCMLHANEDSCNMLGFLYEPENQNISEAYFSLTCHNGHEYGCRALASHAAQSNQVDKARSLAKLACQYEGEKACVARGIDFYKNNKIQEAKESFKRACDLKNAEGCIGACLISAEEGKRKQAKKFLQKACPDSSACGIEVKKLSSQEMKEACKLDMTKEWSYWLRADFNQIRPSPLLRKR